MLLDLASRADILALSAKLDAVLTELAPKATPAAEQLLSVQDIATYTHFDRKTVESWVKVGRFDETGHKVYLRAYEFSGRLRFKRSEVEAFGLGVGVLAPSLSGERPEPTKKPKKPSPVASDKALRVA